MNGIAIGKWFAGLFSLALVTLASLPIIENWRDNPKDNFPLSYYPMFSAKRTEKYTVHYLVGYDPQGNRHVIPYNLAGTGGLNQTRRQINKMVREDKAATLCRAVADKIARQKKQPFTELTTIKVVTGSYRFDDYFHCNKAPLSERVRASCKIERGEP